MLGLFIVINKNICFVWICFCKVIGIVWWEVVSGLCIEKKDREIMKMLLNF